MLSAKTHADITDVIREALRLIERQAVIDKVMTIQRFQQLSLTGPGDPRDYEAKIATGLRGLLHMVEQQGKADFARTLRCSYGHGRPGTAKRTDSGPIA